MAGSSVVVVFVAVAILLSARKQLFSLRMMWDIRQHLDSVSTATEIISIFYVSFTLLLMIDLQRQPSTHYKPSSGDVGVIWKPFRT